MRLCEITQAKPNRLERRVAAWRLVVNRCSSATAQVAVSNDFSVSPSLHCSKEGMIAAVRPKGMGARAPAPCSGIATVLTIWNIARGLQEAERPSTSREANSPTSRC